MEQDRGPEVTVLVVTYRGREYVGDCLRSLAAQTTAHRVLVVDNASDDGTAELLAREFPAVPVMRQARNLGFAGGVAAGLAEVTTPWCALLNDDAVARPDWLAALRTAVQSESAIAAATSRMLLADGKKLNNLGVGLTRAGYGFDLGLGRPAQQGFSERTAVFGFSGGAALLDVAAVREVGGFPSAFFLYYEDTDLSWRLRLAGREIVSVPNAVVEHRHSATIGQHGELFHFHNERNRLLMLLRCAPAGLAVTQLLRFVLTTASVAAKLALRRPLPAALNLRPALRLRVLGGVLAVLPAAIAARRRIGRLAVRSRSEIATTWLGRDPLTNPQELAPHAGLRVLR